MPGRGDYCPFPAEFFCMVSLLVEPVALPFLEGVVGAIRILPLGGCVVLWPWPPERVIWFLLVLDTPLVPPPGV